VLTIGGSCHTLVDKWDLRAPSPYADLDDGDGREGGENGDGDGGDGYGSGGSRDGEVSRRNSRGARSRGGGRGRDRDDADADDRGEALMPEFHVETFEDMGRRLEVEVGLNRHTRLATSPRHVNHQPLIPSRVELNGVV